MPEDILQEQHYYPFGMNSTFNWMNDAGLDDTKYLYNGKELSGEYGLNWMDYSKRWYEPALCRFPNVDPIIDKFPYLTPYNYASNDPVSKIDLYGLQGIPSYIQSFAEKAGQKMVDGVKSVAPSERTSLALQGASNTTLGLAGTAAAAAVTNPVLGAVVLMAGLSETAIGIAQVTDATLGENPSSDAPLHQGQTLPGLVAYANKNPDAALWDAVAGFVPGTASGGNIVGFFEESGSLLKNLRNGNDAAAAKNALQATDAALDVSGVINAVNDSKQSSSSLVKTTPDLSKGQ